MDFYSISILGMQSISVTISTLANISVICLFVIIINSNIISHNNCTNNNYFFTLLNDNMTEKILLKAQQAISEKH